MKDRDGNEIIKGDRVHFMSEGWHSGTIRAFSKDEKEARVDDGDHENDDLHTNFYAVSVWLPLKKIVKRLNNKQAVKESLMDLEK